MIDGKRVLAMIPARGGSKGIPNKNIIDLCGKPLIAYTIEAARNSSYIDDVIVSTDSDEIAGVAREFGAEIPFMRPEALAGDKTSTIDVVVDVISRMRDLGRTYDIFVLLQPTSPLRTDVDLTEAIRTFIENGRVPLLSVSEVNDHPILMRTIEDGHLVNLLKTGSAVRRQDMPPTYRVNGAIYIMNAEDITPETSFNDSPIPYVMPRERSVDIDEPIDLVLAKVLLESLRVP